MGLSVLTPDIFKRPLASLTPEQRRMLGLSRPATDDEIAAYERSQQTGAPADFAGPVFPNPNGVKVSEDTESGVEPTRLPTGVSFQHQNFSGATPLTTVGSPGAAPDTSVWKPVEESASAWKPVEETKTTKEPPGFWDDPRTYLQNRAKDLQTEAQRQTNLAMGAESEGKPFYERLGHRLLSLAPETAAVVDKMVAGGMDWKNAIAIALGVGDPAIPAAYFAGHGAAQLTGVEPGVNKGDVSPENVQNALLAGSAVAGGAAAGGAPRAGTTADLIKAGAKKAAQITPKQAGQIVGGTSGAVAGHGTLSAPGAYYGAKTGGNIVEGVLGKERANAPILSRKPASTRTAPGEIEAADATAENAPYAGEEAAPGETIRASSETKPPVSGTPVKPADVERALNESLGGRPLQPGVPLKNQAVATGAKLPEGFTRVESSSVLKGYKYDPAAQEFEAITNSGQRFRHGEVTPDQFKAFEEADSKGKAWNDLRNAPGVTPLGKVNASGELQPRVKPQFMRSVVLDPETGQPEFSDVAAAKGKGSQNAVSEPKQPAAEAPSEDLTDLLQKSLDQLKVPKGGTMTSTDPGALAKRWGVDPESLASGREQTRGMSPEQTEEYIQKLSDAYKRGQAIEPVMETRDVDNNIIAVDGRARAIAAQRAGIKRIPILVRRLAPK